MMAEEYREPPLILSFLFAVVGAGCIAVSVWMMPWTKTLKPTARETASVRVEEPEIKTNQEAAIPPAIDHREDASPKDAEVASAQTAAETTAETAAETAEENADERARDEIPTESGPWTITLSPKNYSVTAKGWVAIKEIKALFLANPSAKIDLVGSANIMKSKKRATHAAKIVRDRISEGDPNIKWRMTISGVLTEKEIGLSVHAKVVGGAQ